jgi:hypothetical protein
MKRKTIEKQLKYIHSKWCNSITDETVRNLVKMNTIITGGAIASMLLQEEVNDYDMYFRNKETVLALCAYYIKQVEACAIVQKKSIPSLLTKEVDGRISIFIPSAGIIKFNASHKSYKLNSFLPIFITGNAITLSDKVQLVIRFYGEPEEIHANYDFEHTKSYWSSWDNKLVIPGTSAEALLARELRYTGSKYPLSSIIRTRKFINRGWSINAGEYLKMAVQLNQLDLLDVKVLEDQLIGVDTTYFLMFISAIRASMENPDFKLSSDYVIKLIDEIFNEEINNDSEDENNSNED